MVNKSLGIIALLLCALLVEQAATARKKNRPSKIQDSDDEESDSDASDTEDESDEEDSDDEIKIKKNPSKKPGPSRSKSTKRRSTISTKKSAIKDKSTATKKAATKRDAKPGKNEGSNQNKRFVLPNFKKSLVSGTGPLKRKWKTNSYTVDYDRKNKNEIALSWKKGSDEVNIAVSTGGNIAQSFKFGTFATISIALSSSGNVAQDWKVDGSQYQLVKMPGGGVVQNGSLSAKATSESKKLISNWCKENDFFVGKNNCVIY